MKYTRAFLTGCDYKYEWLLPWFFENYLKHNKAPLVFADFGLKDDTIVKKHAHAIIDLRKIPDLIMCDDMNKIIYLYEGKKASTKAQGLAEIKKYQDLEQDILSEHYPNFSFERRLTIEGGQKDNDPIVSFQLDENSVAHKKKEFI